MKTKFIYGAFLALAGIVLQLVGYFLGTEEAVRTAGSMILGPVLWFLSVVAFCLILWLGVRAVRDEKPDQSMTYGQGVGAGVVIALIASVIAAIYAVIHFAIINPAFIQRMIDMMPEVRQQWEQSGKMSEDMMDTMEKFMRMIFSPAGAAVGVFIKEMIGGVIVSLIAAAIVKRNPQPAAQVPPPLA